MKTKYKQIFADLDGTICLSKQKIAPEMKKMLSKLEKPLIVVSGASRDQIEYQLDRLPAIILAQSGNDSPLWKKPLIKNDNERHEISEHVNWINGAKYLTPRLSIRECQHTYSFTGHNAPQDIKNAFDPTREKRQKILKDYPFKSKTIECRIAGTTCFDYTRKDGTKGKNIAHWIKENKLKKKDCIYYGDALFKGGNDESVKGIIKCVSVTGPQDLLCKLQKGI